MAGVTVGPTTASVGSAGRRLVLLLMTVASAGYVGRVAITVVAPGLIKDFGLTPVEMGTVFSAFLAGYTLFQVPSGALADHVSARHILTVSCLGWTLLTVLTAVAGWQRPGGRIVLSELWIIRVMFGIVAAPTYPTSGRTIAAIMPASRQARANSLVLSSIGIGSAVTPILLAPIASRYGWREALGVPVVLCSLAGLLWWQLAPRGLPAPVTRGAGDNRTIRYRDRSSSARPFGLGSFWFLVASYFLQGYLGYIFVFWFFLYLVQVRHFEILNAAAFTALPWVASIVGTPLGGVLSDAAAVRWGSTSGRRMVPVAALSTAAAFLVLGARTTSSLVAVASLTVCTALVLCTEGPFWATMTQLSGERSGLAGGTMNLGGNLGGLISPTLTPWLAGRIGWENALTVTAALAIVASALWLGVRFDDVRESSMPD
jgi:ACS family glucarate transporter-like MFS transporter